MQERVVITGIGCLSCFGVGHRAFVDALAAGRSGIAPITSFDTHDCRSHMTSAVREFHPGQFIAPMKLRRVDEVGRLALAGARLALEDAGWPLQADGHDGLGVALGTYTAGLDSTVAYLRGLIKDGAAGAPALLFSNTVSNAPASLCALEWKLRGPNVTFNQREASSLAALAFAAAAIRDGRAAAMLTGGADHVDEVFFKAHDRFRALAPKRLDGDDTARPFDRRRNGFILGEGGFILLVESAASAAQRGARIYGEILGTGGASEPGGVNDWPAESGAFVRSMRAALTQAAMPPGGVHAIFAAADGSPDLDAIEAQAIGEVFGSRIPVVSIKGAIGEMGAAGAASLAAGLLSFADRRLPPTAGFVEADPGSDVSVCGEARPCEGDVFLVNSAASGGATYSMLVRAAAGHCA